MTDTSDARGLGLEAAEGERLDATREAATSREADTTSPEGDAIDAAQAEWDRTTALDEGDSEADVTAARRTGADPAELPSDADEIPGDDLPSAAEQPETQGVDPVAAELGDEGQGDLSPEDV